MTVPPKKKFKYDASFPKYGFTTITKNRIIKLQCVICLEVLSETSLKLSKLKRHLETKHASQKDKDLSYFKRHEENVLRSRLDSSGKIQKQVAAGVQASFEVARKIALNKKNTNNS